MGLLKRRRESVTAEEILKWLDDNKAGPEQMGGSSYYTVARIAIEQALREICK